MSLSIAKCRYCNTFSTVEHLLTTNGWCGECEKPVSDKVSERITPGVWVACEPAHPASPYSVACGTVSGHTVAVCARAVDASLIAEAGTVYHETALTPRQLQEEIKRLEEYCSDLLSAHDAKTLQRDELLSALKSARRVLTDNGIRVMVGDTDIVSAAITKAEGK